MLIAYCMLFAGCCVLAAVSCSLCVFVLFGVRWCQWVLFGVCKLVLIGCRLLFNVCCVLNVVCGGFVGVAARCLLFVGVCVVVCRVLLSVVRCSFSVRCCC